MSRGTGRWQRIIVATLAECGPFHLRSLLAPHASRAQLGALARAARELESAGRISVTRYMCGGAGEGRTVVHGPGTNPERNDAKPLNVVMVPQRNFDNTYTEKAP